MKNYFYGAILLLILLLIFSQMRSGYYDDSQVPDMSATMIPGVGF